MTAPVTYIDAALDDFFAYQRTSRKKVVTRRLTRETVQRCIFRAIGIWFELPDVSMFLQQYRLAQGRVVTRYHLAARGYGRAAHWYVLSGPSLPVLTSEGMIMAHAEWIVRDLAARAVSDFLNELIPAAAQHPVIKPRAVATRKKVERALNDLMSDVQQDKAVWEQANKRTMEVLAGLTDGELALAEELMTEDGQP